MDCDAFYASVEKRDNPDLRDKPVIVGGGKRGVVSTACYIARIYGVRSAMPMFMARKLCPNAIIVKPRMDAYVEASRQIRSMMDELTPAIEPLSLDEAFLDLTGTEQLHEAPPAQLLVRLVNRMEREVGLTGSIGLSHNKFLAKLASDLDKPKGFSVIGLAETESFLANKPVSMIWGVGAVTRKKLEQVGIRTFGDLRNREKSELMSRFGESGGRLWHLARGRDKRRVSPDTIVKSISNETTFLEDTADPDVLDGHIWRLSEKVSDRAKAKNRAGRIIVLKVKRANHAIITRRTSLAHPTQMADRIYRHAKVLFSNVQDRGPFRLIGVGISGISDSSSCGDQEGLIDSGSRRRLGSERTTDEIRARFGPNSIIKGRSLR